MKNPTFLFIVSLFIFSCTEKKTQSEYQRPDIDSLKNQFEKYITDKDSFFVNAGSPLLQNEIESFRGLNYFAYDAALRFEGPVHLYPNPEATLITGSKHGRGRDDIRRAEKYGYFEFKYKNGIHQLEIIKILPNEPGGQGHLFLGFWDETSGNETYGGGRYIDMVKADRLNYIVDFNFAYNPYCAYNKRYSCAIPPLENSLNFAVKTGEKIYKEH